MESGPRFRPETHKGLSVFKAEGQWTAAFATDLETLAHTAPPVGSSLLIDLQNVQALDTFGAWAIQKLHHDAMHRGIDVQLSVPGTAQAALFTQLDLVLPRSRPTTRFRDLVVTPLMHLGKQVETSVLDAGLFLSLIGHLSDAFIRGLRHPSRLRLKSAVHHLDRVGLQAVPIIALMTFLIGCVIAQQGFFHFQRFGATDYVVDLVSILVLREIGVLLVMIMIAGRSGSAYTAEIGSMKMREEIDAIRTMGLDPVAYLILPRILALIVAAPLLTMVGNAAALYGAGVVAWIYGDVSPAVFLARLHEAASYVDLEVGVIKAPVMAAVVGAVSCLEGLKVRGSTESLGFGTTASVVRSIFLVIVLDGIFAILFASVGM